MGLSGAKNICCFEFLQPSSRGWIQRTGKGKRDETMRMLPLLLYFRPVKITRPALPGTVSFLRPPLSLAHASTVPRWNAAASPREAEGKKIAKASLSRRSRECADTDGNTTYRLFTLSVFVTASTFSLCSTKRRSMTEQSHVEIRYCANSPA